MKKKVYSTLMPYFSKLRVKNLSFTLCLLLLLSCLEPVNLTVSAANSVSGNDAGLTAAAPAVSLSESSIPFGGALMVTLENVDLTALDSGAWLTLYPAGYTNKYDEYLWYQYVDQLFTQTNSAVFTADETTKCTAGKSYVLVLYADSGYENVLAQSSPFSVTGETAKPTITMLTDEVDFNDEISFTVEHINLDESGVWLAMTDAASNDIYSYHWYEYTNNTSRLVRDGNRFTVQACAANNFSGNASYKFNLFSGGGYTLEASSEPVTVRPAPAFGNITYEAGYAQNMLFINGSCNLSAGCTVQLKVTAPDGSVSDHTTQTTEGGYFHFTISADVPGYYNAAFSSPEIPENVQLSMLYNSLNMIPEFKVLTPSILVTQDACVSLSGTAGFDGSEKLALYRDQETSPVWEAPVLVLASSNGKFTLPLADAKLPAGSYRLLLTGNRGILAQEGAIILSDQAVAAIPADSFSQDASIPVSVTSLSSLGERDWIGLYPADTDRFGEESTLYKMLWYGYLNEMEVSDGSYLFNPGEAFLNGAFAANATQYSPGRQFKFILFLGDNYKNPVAETAPFTLLPQIPFSADAAVSENTLTVTGSTLPGYEAELTLTRADGSWDRFYTTADAQGSFSFSKTLDSSYQGVNLANVKSGDSNSLQFLLPFQKKKDAVITLSGYHVLPSQDIVFSIENLSCEDTDWIELTDTQGNVLLRRPLSDLDKTGENTFSIPIQECADLSAAWQTGAKVLIRLFYQSSSFEQAVSERFYVSDAILDAQWITDGIHLTGLTAHSRSQTLHLTVEAPLGELFTSTAQTGEDGVLDIIVPLKKPAPGIYTVTAQAEGWKHPVTASFSINRLNVLSVERPEESLLSIRAILSDISGNVLLTAEGPEGFVAQTEDALSSQGTLTWELPIDSALTGEYLFSVYYKDSLKAQTSYLLEPYSSLEASYDESSGYVTVWGYMPKAYQEIGISVSDAQGEVLRRTQSRMQNGSFLNSFLLPLEAGEYFVSVGGLSDIPQKTAFQVTQQTPKPEEPTPEPEPEEPDKPDPDPTPDKPQQPSPDSPQPKPEPQQENSGTAPLPGKPEQSKPKPDADKPSQHDRLLPEADGLTKDETTPPETSTPDNTTDDASSKNNISISKTGSESESSFHMIKLLLPLLILILLATAAVLLTAVVKKRNIKK